MYKKKKGPTLGTVRGRKQFDFRENQGQKTMAIKKHSFGPENFLGSEINCMEPEGRRTLQKISRHGLKLCYKF